MAYATFGGAWNGCWLAARNNHAGWRTLCGGNKQDMQRITYTHGVNCSTVTGTYGPQLFSERRPHISSVSTFSFSCMCTSYIFGHFMSFLHIPALYNYHFSICILFYTRTFLLCYCYTSSPSILCLFCFSLFHHLFSPFFSFFSEALWSPYTLHV